MRTSAWPDTPSEARGKLQGNIRKGNEKNPTPATEARVGQSNAKQTGAKAPVFFCVA